MAKVGSPSKPLTTNSRVVAVRDLQGVPAGTGGRIKIVSGLTWIRYWVEFDNGVWLGSVDAKSVVAEDDWPDYQRRRAEEQARAAEPAPAAAPAPAAEAGAEPEAGAVSSRIPAHLLERSKAAKSRKAGG